jgi:hypothetical protein
MREPWPIEWHGRLVGWLVDPFPEMFNCSGQWRPAERAGDEFITALRVAGPDGLRVVLHGVPGVVDELPDQEGGLTVHWWPRA